MSDSPPSDRQALAAQLMADGKLTCGQIAAKVGVSRRALFAWRKRPEFRAAVARHVAEAVRELREAGIRRERERARLGLPRKRRTKPS